MFKKGQKFGVYTIKEIIAEDPYQGTYLSQDPFFNSQILLNIWPINHLDDEQQTSLGQKLDHLFALENSAIVPVFDTGYEDRNLYFTTNFFVEDSFGSYIARGLSEREILTILIRLAKAFDYAAAEGFYHGEIKLGDIVVDENSQVFLLNFGVRWGLHEIIAAADEELDPVAQTLVSFGRLIDTMFSCARMEDLSEARESQLNTICARCLGSDVEQFKTFDDLRYCLEQLLNDLSAGDVQTATEQNKSLQTISERKINEEQRALLLPHVRELISAKREIEEELEQNRLHREELDIELGMAREEIEQLSKRMHKVVRFDRRKERIQLISAVFAGLCLASLTWGAFYWLGRDEQSIASASHHVPQAQVQDQSVAQPKPDAELNGASEEPLDNTLDLALAQPLDGSADLAQVGAQAAEELVQQVTPDAGEIEDPRPVFEAQEADPAPVKPVVPAQPDVMSDIRGDESVAVIEQYDAQEAVAIIGTIERWSEAWARQQIDIYLQSYSDSFLPGSGASLEAWKAIREQRLQKPDWIEVGVDEIRIDSLDKSKAQVSFRQHYRADGYEDWSEKKLDLAYEGDNWRIVRERTLRSWR